MGTLLRLPRLFWLTAAGLLCWISLPSGAYFAVSGYFGLPTFVLLAVGIAALVAIIDGRALKSLEARDIPSAQLTMALLLWGAVGLVSVYQLAASSPASPGGSLVLTIIGLGTVVLLGALLWQAVTAWRRASRP